MSEEVKTLKFCHVYDIVQKRQEAFVDELNGRFNNIQVIGTDNAKNAVRDADIIVTGGPIQIDRKPTIISDWIKPGALIITIDYDSYVTDECIDAMDIVLTDDYDQLDDARIKDGKFLGVNKIDADNAQMIANGTAIRQNEKQRILAFNLGIALEDLATASEVLRVANEQEIGIILEP